MEDKNTLSVRVNLDRVAVLILDNPLGLEILGLILLGFGVRDIHRCRTIDEAKEVMRNHQIDLIVLETLLPEGDAFEFVRWFRRSNLDNNRFASTLLLSAHTAASKVAKTRDCGANFLIGKPVSAKTLIERILWVAREKRQFLEAGAYFGPDRRFHDLGVPEGLAGRRRDDVASADTSVSPEVEAE